MNDIAIFRPPVARTGKHSKGETMTTSEPPAERITASTREDMPLPWLTTAVGVTWQLPLPDERVWKGCGERVPGG